MKRHLKILFALMSLSFKRYLEQRFSTIGILLLSAVSLVFFLLFINVMFTFTKELYGWSKYQVFFLTGTFNVVAAIFSLLFLRSINFLPNDIKRGDLDIVLTKPVNSQFFVSLRLVRIYAILDILPGILLMYYSLSKISLNLSPFNTIFFIVNLIFGIIILYTIFFITATLAFWLQNVTALSEIFKAFNQPLSVPIDILGKPISFILTFIIPLAFVITVPVKVLFGIIPLEFTLVSLSVAVLLLGFSIWFWNFALKYYTSASS